MYSASAANARQQFSANNLHGLSGPRIVVMCFDRIERDLSTAITAIERNDHYEANASLAHAQDLVSELAMMLDTGVWEHASALMSLYDYLLRLLAVANMKKDPARVREALRHVNELGGAFRDAERAAVPATAPELLTTGTDGPRPGTGRMSFQA